MAVKGIEQFPVILIIGHIWFVFPSSEKPAVQETQETQVRSLGREDPLEQDMATHFNILS